MVMKKISYSIFLFYRRLICLWTFNNHNLKLRTRRVSERIKLEEGTWRMDGKFQQPIYCYVFSFPSNTFETSVTNFFIIHSYCYDKGKKKEDIKLNNDSQFDSFAIVSIFLSWCVLINPMICVFVNVFWGYGTTNK